LEFPTPSGNGIDMHAGDARQAAVTTVAQSQRFQADEQSALTFVEGTEEEIQLSMQEFGRVVITLPAVRASALVDTSLFHDWHP